MSNGENKTQSKIVEWLPEFNQYVMQGAVKQETKDVNTLIKRRRFEVGAGQNIFGVDVAQGLWLGGVNYTTAPFKVSLKGEVSASSLSLPNFYNDDGTSIVYTGTWSQVTQDLYLGGSAYLSATVTDYATISFTGTSIALYFTEASNAGKVKVYVDSVLDATVDLYTTAVFYRFLAWSKTGLQNIAHTVKIEVETMNVASSANNVWFEGYSLFPNDGIKIDKQSNVMYEYAPQATTDTAGFAQGTFQTPSGFSLYCIAGVSLQLKYYNTRIGSATSQWDVTNPVGTTFRYTWDGTGTDPLVTTYVRTGINVVISGGFNVGNQGTFPVTAVSTDYFEVTNAGGVAETNIIGTTINTSQTTPKVSWRGDSYRLYDGAASTTFIMITALMISKI